ncbi:hypothetical protein ELH70_14695 [Rhizobium ruizarguesonis]|uniref:hypothetical protein n=1 Tax=Rhizobium ruizarguesonis TaxID=2081791 RepID=UPI001032175D|nr:hypothetical protein [Rhizobium ruizarguesonis]TAZ73815.1 hypothetical protein ELH70_14695 [Rhizobium ruizarguesonis]TBA00416.1 hypothetical protein ELH69_13880 [Rhizobium ruizarguesonis]
MNDDEIFSVAKEISDRFVAEWDRLKGDRVAWRMSEVQERVFFEALLSVVNARHMTTNDVVEMIRVYLRHADWIGLLVCDSSPSNGNGSHGPTWALVRPRGILASFGGGPFQAIYEPLYDIHDEDDDSSDDAWYDSDDSNLTLEERKKRSDATAESYLRSHFGLPYEDQDDPERSYITTLPEGFRNPLILEEFVNGGPGQDIIGVSRRLLLRDSAESDLDWIEKHRNSQGIASNFDILTAAALDYHQHRPIIRQLRSWTEDQYVGVEEAVMTMAAIWPKFLAGQLTFVSAQHRSWVVVEQGLDKPLLFERENWPINTSLSRVLAVLSGIHSFRGITCGFVLSKAGQVVFDGKSGKILRLIAHDFEPSAEETRRAIGRMTQQLIGLGHDREAVRSSIADPCRLGELIDPDGRLLRKYRGHPEQRLFEMAVSISERKTSFQRPSLISEHRSDELYGGLGGDGRDEVYLSDGLWISPDGLISDKGR